MENNNRLPEKHQTTSIALWKDSNAGMVEVLRSDIKATQKFSALDSMVSNKVSDVLDCEPISSLISYAGEANVKSAIECALVRLAGMFNGNAALNLKDFQVPVIADMLIENYKWESVEDFILCFRKASCGLYGEIYRIDGAVIGTWFARYLDEKYQALEERHTKQKQSDKGLDISKVAKEAEKEYGVGTEKYEQAKKMAAELIEYSQRSPKDNAKENEYQRFKLQRAEWQKECIDPESGKLLEGKPEFKEWIKNKGL